MSILLSLSNLVTHLDSEPRIPDNVLFEKLGFVHIDKCRQLIARHSAELKAYGGLPSVASKTAGKGGRPKRTYFLNEPQALLICMFSRTDKAAAVRKALIEVFLAYRHGHLVEATINDQQAFFIRRAVIAKQAFTEAPYKAIWMQFNTRFGLKRYTDLPVSQFTEALAYIDTMQLKEDCGEDDEMRGVWIDRLETCLAYILQRNAAVKSSLKTLQNSTPNAALDIIREHIHAISISPALHRIDTSMISA